MEKAELVIVRRNQEQDWFLFEEVKSLDCLPNYMSRSQEFLRGWKWVSVQFSMSSVPAEPLCFPGAAGNLGIALLG